MRRRIKCKTPIATTELRTSKGRPHLTNTSTVVTRYSRRSLQIAEEKRKGDEETMAQSQRVISTMQKELQRKNEAIQQMRAHTSSISENYNAMNEKFKSEQRSVKLGENRKPVAAPRWILHLPAFSTTNLNPPRSSQRLRR